MLNFLFLPQLVSPNDSDDPYHVSTVSSNQGRIINGEDAKEGQWHFMASIHDATHHFCGGSILNDDTILTAAHCVTDQAKVSETVVILGQVDYRKPDPKYVYKAVKFIPSPNFVNKGVIQGNDVGVIKLDRMINFSDDQKVRKICLPSPNDEPVVDKCIALGWGRTNSSKGSGSPTLRQADLPILTVNECNQLFQGYNDKVIYCAGYKDGSKAICMGDSGSSLVCPSKSDPVVYLQYGISSFGQKDCSSYGYFTKPAVYLDWIKKQAESCLALHNILE